MNEIELTKKEQKAVDDLQKLMNRWPKSLWLFNNGTMYVMKYKEDGEVGMRGDSIDPSLCVTTISGIHSDGGDW